MTYALLLVMSVVFLEVFVRTKPEVPARSILRTSQEAWDILRSSEIDEREKEKKMRYGSLAILKATLSLTGALLLAVLVPAILYLIAVQPSPVRRELFAEALTSIPVLVVMVVVTLVYALGRSVFRERLRSR